MSEVTVMIKTYYGWEGDCDRTSVVGLFEDWNLALRLNEALNKQDDAIAYYEIFPAEIITKENLNPYFKKVLAKFETNT